MMTATNSATPDNDYGWGVVQALDALHYPVAGVELIPAREVISALIVRATPNPVVSRSTIELLVSGDRPRFIEVLLFDVAGRLCGVIGRDELAPGVHRFDWTPGDLSGRRLAPGVYFIQVAENGKPHLTGRVVVSR
jgi:hypothetical protein